MKSIHEEFMATIEERLSNNWTNGADVRHLLQRQSDLLRENAELREKIDLLLDANSKTGKNLLDHSELVNKRGKELAELTASNARLRKAIQHIHDTTFNQSLKLLLEQALAETPAESLAAITGPLQAHIADLRTALTKISKHHKLPIDTVASQQILSTAYGALEKTPAQSLKAIQDAARAEERKNWERRETALVKIIKRFGGCDCDSCIDLECYSHDEALAIRDRANGGEAK